MTESGFRFQYYQETGAARDAVKRFVRSKDTPRRFRSQYPICSLSEAEFLAYVRAPTVYVQDKAEQYIQDNQEAFLLQFLCNDAYQEAYAAIARDASHPAQRMRAITDALERCGGKTVAVTVRRGNAEMTFKTPVKSLLGYHDFYDLCEASMEDYHTFSRMFGDVTCSYQAEDIVCITYGKRTIYEAPDLSPAPMERTMTMPGK